MNILMVGNFGRGWDGSICDEEHIAGQLEHFGHHVTRWQRGEAAEFSKQYEFALIAQWDGYGPYLFEMLRQYTKKIVYWAFDYQSREQDWHMRLVEQCDLYLSKRLSDGQAFGDKWQFLAQDFGPMFLDKYAANGNFKKDIDLLFTGTYLPWAEERNAILKAVDEKYGLNIRSVNPEGWRGAGFKNVAGPLMDQDIAPLISRTKINLSIDHTYDPGYWSDRNAQIMLCGGFVLFRYVPMSHLAFRSNIGYFYDQKTCSESIDYWLANDEDRENLAGFGYDYAVQNLTARERVADLLTIVTGVL
jgi:hypothetical protein